MQASPLLHSNTLLSALLAVSLVASTAAQTPASPPPANPDAEIVTSTDTKDTNKNPQATPDTSPDLPPAPVSGTSSDSRINQSWALLTSAAASHNPDTRVQALAALGTMGSNPQAASLIQHAMQDPDLDVRSAAILAAEQTKNRRLITPIQNLLEDKEPQVAYTAALTLWKMKDRMGEDILLAVVNGDRSANATIVNSTMHDAGKQLHRPAALAKMGAMQGVSMFLGPFGYGLTAYEYMHKNGGDSARVNAIEQLGRERTPAIRQSLLDALGDKDPAVRAAAAKALGQYHDKRLRAPLSALLDDPKHPVRLTAAAAFINSSSTGKHAPSMASPPSRGSGQLGLQSRQP